MQTKIRYADRIPAIQAELEALARQGQTTTYASLGQIVGIPTQGPWRGALDQIASEEVAAGRPDITFLVVNRQTGVSSRIGHRDAHRPTAEQRQASQEEQARIWKHHARHDNRP